MRPFSRRILLILSLCLGIAAVPALAHDQDEQLDVGGRARTYAIHVPDGAPPADGFPMFLVFHGGGGQGARARALTRFDALADARRFVVVYPDGVDRHWNDGRATIKHPQDDVGFVGALIDDLQKRLPIDAGRVYAAGMSNGALFAERLGCDLSQRIAAIAAVAGSLPREIVASCRPARAVAVMQIDGTADPIMPFDGGAVASFGGLGEGGQVLSVHDTVLFWAERSHCAALFTAKDPIQPLESDPTWVQQTSYTTCPASAAVTLLAVQGGGHTWPGGPQYAPRILVGATSRQVDASGAIVDFFLSRPRR